MKGALLIAILLFCLFGILDEHMISDAPDQRQNSSNWVALATIIFLGIAAYGGIKAARYVIKIKCPGCNNWGASRIVQSTIINSGGTRHNLTKRITYYDFFGNEIGSTGRDVTASDRLTVNVEELRECNHCHNKWAVRKK
jgi:hypothetical protein